MRNKSNRFKVRRLFVLGAGASYSATARRRPAPAKQAPLDMDFAGRILDLRVRRPKWVEESRAEVERCWAHHQAMRSLGLEEAVIRQLAHLEFIDAIHPRRRQNAVEDAEWLTDVAHLMCFVLGRVREHNDTYSRFLQNVYPASGVAAEYSDRIITFNYDCLLDRHLLSRFSAGRVYFDSILKAPDEELRRTDKHADPLLIKLHGSANWRCSAAEFAQILSDLPLATGEETHYIEKVWISSRLPAPSDDEYPLIIPPLPKKPITRISLFRYLWTRAYEYLHSADEIVIAGYSLPHADQLAQSLFGNFANAALKQVSVIDPNPAIIARWQQLLRRRNVGTATWTYYDDFASYVDRMGDLR